MKVLVTGGSGFIGSHLTKELKAYGHRVANMDRRRGGFADCRKPGSLRNFIEGDRPDVVIHLAAKVGRLFGEDDVQETISDNAGMTALIAQTCGDYGIRLIYASTSEVYGDQGEQVCHEDGPFTKVPHNAYGLTKRHGEEFCQLYAPDGLTILRFSMPYGPGLPAGRGRAALVNFLYNALHLQPLTVHRDSERSWCYITDTVKAVRLLLETETPGAFNIGRDDNALPMLEVAEMACDLAGAPYDFIELVDPPERQTVVKRLSTEKIRALGWEPKVDLVTGMVEVFEWVQKTYPVTVAA